VEKSTIVMQILKMTQLS